MTLMKTKKSWKAVFYLFILCLLSGTFFYFRGFAASGISAGPNIEVDLTYGYDNSAKGGRFIPVYLTCKNPGTEVFEGEIRFLSMESDQELYRYDYPISIQPGETIKNQVDLPLGVYNDQIFITVVNDQHQVVLKKLLNLNIRQDYAELFVGVLSDSKEELDYLDGIGINYGLLKTKLFHLDNNIFPEDEVGLNLLDVILISDYNVNELSENQMQSLNEWVEHGGLLLLGTGQRAAEVLLPFGADLLEQDLPQPRKTRVNMGVEYAVSDPGDSEIELYCVEFSLENGSVIFSDDQLPLVSKVKKEQGAIAAAAFDFKELKQFALEHPDYVDKLFVSLLGDEKISQLSDIVYNGDAGRFWSVKNMLNIGEADRLPNMGLYVAVISLYLLIIGPGIYGILKRKKMSKYHQFSVVIVSFLFTGIIYVLSSPTRFRSTFFTYATFKDVSEGNVNETTFVNIRTPDNKPYQVFIDPTYLLKPVTQVFYPEGTGSQRLSGSEQPDVIMKYQEDEIVLLTEQVAAFESRYIQLDKNEKNEKEEGFLTDLSWFDGVVSGTVENRFRQRVEDVTIIMSGQILKLGTFEPGEKKQLDNEKPLSVPLRQTAEVAELIVQKEDCELTKMWKKTNLISYFLDYYLTSSVSDMKIFGVCSEDQKGSFLLKKNLESDGLTLVSSTLDINTVKDEYIYRSGIEKRPKVISGQYDGYSNSMSLSDTVILEYSLGNDLAVSKLEFIPVADLFRDQQKYDYFSVFTGSMYFFNYDTGNYELMDSQQMAFDRNQLKPYLSPGNTLMVKYICEESQSSNWNVLLPMLMMIGREE